MCEGGTCFLSSSRTYRPPYTHEHAHTHAHTQTCAYTHTHAQTHTFLYIHKHTDLLSGGVNRLVLDHGVALNCLMHTHKHTNARTHTHIHTHKHTHAHTHRPAEWWSQSTWAGSWCSPELSHAACSGPCPSMPVCVCVCVCVSVCVCAHSHYLVRVHFCLPYYALFTTLLRTSVYLIAHSSTLLRARLPYCALVYLSVHSCTSMHTRLP